MSKTHAPKSEAKSHKPTFGISAEKPGTEQTEPQGDQSVTEKNADDHENVGQEVLDNLSAQQRSQETQLDPDKHQKDIHQSTTQDVLADPVSRPKTIDPETGQVHYVGVAAKLNGNTIAHESDV